MTDNVSRVTEVAKSVLQLNEEDFNLLHRISQVNPEERGVILLAPAEGNRGDLVLRFSTAEVLSGLCPLIGRLISALSSSDEHINFQIGDATLLQMGYTDTPLDTDLKFEIFLDVQTSATELEQLQALNQGLERHVSEIEKALDSLHKKLTLYQDAYRMTRRGLDVLVAGDFLHVISDPYSEEPPIRKVATRT